MSILVNLLSVERAPLFTMLDHCQRLDVQKADRHTARWSVQAGDIVANLNQQMWW